VNNLSVILRVSFGALSRNKLRTALTMLGIIIGVGAVICVVAIGQGASDQVKESIRNLGENMIWIEAGGRQVNGVRTGNWGTKSLTVLDARAIEQQIPLVQNVSPHVDTGVQLVYGGQNWYTTVRGVAPAYLQVRHWPVEAGSAFFQHDVEEATDVCLLGKTVVENLFGQQDPVGQRIRVKNLPCLVVGVLAPKGQSPFGGDQDDVLIMPYTTVQRKIKGITWVDDIMCSAVSAQALVPAERQITALLRERHHLRPDQPDDFNLRHPAAIAETQAQSQRIMTILLASIASISLLVGGIGIMNIMLVSVTERTREIGVRMAVGATEQDVQMQFLSEAVMLSCLGGTVGVVTGVLGSYLVSRVLEWRTRVSPEAIVIATMFCLAVGVFFGYYPAHKAACLDPIDALRYE
jgi:putative ABC transport system permease protein